MKVYRNLLLNIYIYIIILVVTGILGGGHHPNYNDFLRIMSIRFLLRGFVHLIFTVFLQIYPPWPDEDAGVRDARCGNDA